MRFSIIIVLLLIIFWPNNLLAYNPSTQAAPFQFELPQIDINNIINDVFHSLGLNMLNFNNNGGENLSSVITKVLLQFFNLQFFSFWSDLIKTFLSHVRFQ